MLDVSPITSIEREFFRSVAVDIKSRPHEYHAANGWLAKVSEGKFKTVLPEVRAILDCAGNSIPGLEESTRIILLTNLITDPTLLDWEWGQNNINEDAHKGRAWLLAHLQGEGLYEAWMQLALEAAKVLRIHQTTHNGDPALDDPKKRPLTPNEQAILDALTNEPMPGPDVVAKLAKTGIKNIDTTQLSRICSRKHIKTLGVGNRKGAGYFKI